MYSCYPSLVEWCCRIRWLHLYRESRPPLIECPRYDTKPFVSKALVLELGGMLSIPSLLWLPSSLQPSVVVSIRVPSMGQLEQAS